MALPYAKLTLTDSGRNLSRKRKSLTNLEKGSKKSWQITMNLWEMIKQYQVYRQTWREAQKIDYGKDWRYINYICLISSLK